MSKRTIAAIVFFCVVTVVFFFGALLMHPFGFTNESDMDDYIIDHTQEETGANNGVTSVVFDYRGFDTLGEATILFTAVAGVILIFRRLTND
jgi:multisubunit Na+/H+ antiporter MnhB subunit